MAKNNNNCNCDDNCPICNNSTTAGSSSVDGVATGTGAAPKPTAGSELMKRDPYEIANGTQITGQVPSTILMDVLASIQSVIPDVINNVSVNKSIFFLLLVKNFEPYSAQCLPMNVSYVQARRSIHVKHWS